MKIWSAVESDEKSYENIRRVREVAEKAINEALEASSLRSFDLKIRYVPIVMPDDVLEMYPARYRAQKKERIYNFSPQLDFQTFVSGSWISQMVCYLDGLRECARRLPDFGANKYQVEEFLGIIDMLKSKLALPN